MNKKLILGLAITCISLSIISFYISMDEATKKIIALFFDLINPSEKIQPEQMIFLKTLFDLFLPWIFFAILIQLFAKLLNKTRKRKAGIIILASFIQMFLPDPFAERTIKMEHLQTKKAEKKRDNDKDQK